MSQQRLAEACGISYQLLYKYERGGNRIPASRLCGFARLLKVPVAYFFAGLPLTAADHQDDALHSPETARLLAAYYRIAAAKRRRAVYQFIRAMTETTRI